MGTGWQTRPDNFVKFWVLSHWKKKEVGCFNHTMIILVTDKLKRQWLCVVGSYGSSGITADHIIIIPLTTLYGCKAIWDVSLQFLRWWQYMDKNIKYIRTQIFKRLINSTLFSSKLKSLLPTNKNLLENYLTHKNWTSTSMQSRAFRF